MELLEATVLFYLLAVNGISLICFGLDKLFAKKRHFRISEAWLLSVSLIGGSLGSIIGMVLFHHKISKPKFRYAIPFLFLIQICLVLIYLIQTAYGIKL